MNETNPDFSRENKHSNRISALEQEVANLTKENRELKELLAKLDAEDIQAHRIYKQVKEKLDLEHEEKKKYDNPVFAASVSIIVAGVTALLSNASFTPLLAKQAAKNAVDETSQEIKKDVRKAKEDIEKVQKQADDVKDEVQQAKKDAENVENEVKKAQTAAKEVEDKVEQLGQQIPR